MIVFEDRGLNYPTKAIKICYKSSCAISKDPVSFPFGLITIYSRWPVVFTYAQQEIFIIVFVCCSIISSLVVDLSDTWLFCNLIGVQHARLLCLWDFPSKNTRVDGHFLFPAVFLNQESNLHLLLVQVHSLPLSHQGRPSLGYVNKNQGYIFVDDNFD